MRPGCTARSNFWVRGWNCEVWHCCCCGFLVSLFSLWRAKENRARRKKKRRAAGERTSLPVFPRADRSATRAALRSSPQSKRLEQATSRCPANLNCDYRCFVFQCCWQTCVVHITESYYTFFCYVTFFPSSGVTKCVHVHAKVEGGRVDLTRLDSTKCI